MAQSVEEKGPITYSAVLTPGEDGWICAQIAEVPEAISQGRTLEEAKANVTEALEWRRDEGEPLPEPAVVTVTRSPCPAPDLLVKRAELERWLRSMEPNAFRAEAAAATRPGGTP
jgi:predicted RNase H-like HicB family nuclease